MNNTAKILSPAPSAFRSGLTSFRSFLPLRRSCKTDFAVIGIWVGLVLTGQTLLSKTSPVLEWSAVLWLLAGIWFVRPTLTLPLLILSCPAFMGEIQRTWSWVQLALWFCLLTRVLIEYRFTRRHYVMIAVTGAVALLLSWPADAPELIHRIARFPRSEWFGQWVHARAQWSIYPFRQTFDRSVLAMLIAAVVLSGKYFSSHRIWAALTGCGFMMLTASLGAALLPWQTPHQFLGTTNYASFSGYWIHGAGYNPIFFTLPMALFVPWLFIPWRQRLGRLSLAAAGLLLPVPFVMQRALMLAWGGLAVLGACLLLGAAFRPRSRTKLLSRWGRVWSGRKILLPLLALGVAISAVWAVKVGVAHSLAQKLHIGHHPPPLSQKNTADTTRLKKTAKRAPKAPNHIALNPTDGSRIWVDSTNLPQGELVFSSENKQWADLRAGTLITIATSETLYDEHNQPISAEDPAGAPPASGQWIHISTPREAQERTPRIISRSNLPALTNGHFMVASTGWECRIVDSRGSVVMEAIGNGITGWRGGRLTDGHAVQLESDRFQPSLANYRRTTQTTLGAANVWGADDQHRQRLDSLRGWRACLRRMGPGQSPGLVINEYSGVGPAKCLRDGGRDVRLGIVRGNGGPWIELAVVSDSLDVRGWKLQWAVRPLPVATAKSGADPWPERVRRWFKGTDRSRYYMWRDGWQWMKEHGLWVGQGAGTWGGFHRAHNNTFDWRRGDNNRVTKTTMVDHPHMHNTFLDLMFEYGVVPMCGVYLFVLWMIGRIVFTRHPPSKLWLFYLVAVACMALFQHLFYSLPQMTLILPGLLLVARAMRQVLQRPPP